MKILKWGGLFILPAMVVHILLLPEPISIMGIKIIGLIYWCAFGLWLQLFFGGIPRVIFLWGLALVAVGGISNIAVLAANEGLFPVAGYSYQEFVRHGPAPHYIHVSEGAKLILLADHKVLRGSSVGDILAFCGMALGYLGLGFAIGGWFASVRNEYGGLRAYCKTLKRGR